MPISPFLKSLRKKIGHDLIVLPSVSICHIDEQNRVLLMKFGDTDQWGLPGGAVEPNEQPTTAAVREMWEETGLHVKLTEVRAVYGGPEAYVEYPNGDRVSYVMSAFAFEAIGGHLHPRDGEALALAYYAQSELSTLDVATWTATLLPHLFDPSTPPFFPSTEWSPSD